MLKFQLNGKLGNYNISLPTSLNEVSEDYLTNLANRIKIGDNYSLIGIAYHESLPNVLMMNSSKKLGATTTAVPLFIGAGKTDDEFINSLKPGDRIIIAGSDVALGHHVNCQDNKITIGNVLALAEGDNNAYIKATAATKEVNAACYFLELKLVPNCAIHGAYNIDKDASNPVNYFVNRVVEVGA